MRTTAAAATAAITSAPPLIPRRTKKKNSSDLTTTGTIATSREAIDAANTVTSVGVETTIITKCESSDHKDKKNSAVINCNSNIDNLKNNSNMNEKQPQNQKQVQQQSSLMTSIPPSTSNMNNNNNNDMNNSNNNNNQITTLNELSERNRKLAEDLAEFVERVVQGMHPSQKSGKNKDESDDSIACDEKEAELQLQTARMIRQILPGNRELLPIVQEKGWTQLLFSWLNLHDRPAVQVEALLALTSIADLSHQCLALPDAASIMHTSSNGLVASAAAKITGLGSMSSNSVYNNSYNMDGSMNNTTTQYLMQQQQMQQQYMNNSNHTNFSNSNRCITQNISSLTQWNYDYDPSQNMATQVLRDPVFQAAVNSGDPAFQAARDVVNSPYFQNSIKMSHHHGIGGSSSLANIPMPSQPSSFNNNINNNTNVPYPAQFMSNSSQPMFQNLLMNNDEALPTLISLLSSPSSEVYEHAMWILGSMAAAPSNLAGPNGVSSMNDQNDKNIDKISPREKLLNAGVMPPLLACLEKNHQNIALQRIGSWAISNFVEQQGKSGRSCYFGSSAFDISSLMRTLKRLLDATDHDVLNFTCWSLSHLCDSTASLISVVVTSNDPNDPPGGLVPRLVELLHHENWKVTKPALRTIGNIVCAEYDEDSGDNKAPTDFTEVILECNAVSRLKLLIAHSNREIQKEACWTLSNIAAGTVDQIQAVIDSGVIPPLVELVNDKNTDQEVRSEASWVVLNATSCGSDKQISVLVTEGCVSVLGLLLEEATMVSMALEGLERVLQVEKNNELARIEKAQSSEEANNCHESPLVNPYMVANAMKKTNSSSKVNKKVQQIWNDHFVSCALCNKPYSKHRATDAKFCEECKCHVCSNCNCEVYHLSYQEELWAASEEKVVATKQAKKSKKQKKKEKRKEKNKTKGQVTKPSSDSSEKAKGKKDQTSDEDDDVADGNIGAESIADQNSVDAEKSQPPIDFSLYLQQTGSIIALARLMDDFYKGDGYTCVNLPNQ